MPDAIEADDQSDFSSYGGVLWEDALAGQSDARDFGERSADDLHIIYTGGTTGFPKGVMWRHEDFWRVLGGGIDFYTGEPLAEYDQSEQAKLDGADGHLPAQPADARRGAGGPADAPVRGPPDGASSRSSTPSGPGRSSSATKVQLIFMTGDAMARR